MSRVVKPEIFTEEYAHVFDGDDRWRALPVPEGGLFAWDEAITYVRRPPFFEGMSLEPKPLGAIHGARVLVSCWATPSRPTTSRPRARSPRIAPPGSICASMASRSATSTATARGAATTR